MRIAVAAAVLVLGWSARAGADGPTGNAPSEPPPPAIDDAIKQATAASKPLVLEFHAEWCKPCHEFAARTLPDPRVQRALTGVVFVRYDAEAGPGIAAAAKYNIDAFPTFLVVDKTGIERLRHSGAPVGESGVRQFVGLVDNARNVAMDEADVRATLKAKPGDPQTMLAAARWFAARKQPKEALAQFEAVAKVKAAPAAVRAEAKVAATRLRRLEQWKKQLVAEKLAAIKADPGAVSLDELAIATVDSGLPAAQVQGLFTAVIAANPDVERLNSLAYVAIAARANDQALDAAKRVVAASRDAAHLDTLAECFHAKGDRAQALAHADEAIKLAKGSLAVALKENRERFANTTAEVRDVIQVRLRAADLWERLAKVDSLAERVADPASLEAARKQREERMIHSKARTALATSLAKGCRGHAGRMDSAIARVVVGDKGQITSSVLLLEPEATKPLRECLTKALASATLPYDPDDTEISLTIKFKTRGR